jgi:hypothetical protein
MHGAVSERRQYNCDAQKKEGKAARQGMMEANGCRLRFRHGLFGLIWPCFSFCA